jgi:hypothetical protein
MTAKEFVKERYPKAQVKKYEWGSGLEKRLRQVYYLCWSEHRGIRLSEGTSESNAWTNAKKDILQDEQS